MKKLLVLALTLMVSSPAIAMNALVKRSTSTVRKAMVFNKMNTMNKNNTQLLVALDQSQKRHGAVGATVGAAIGKGGVYAIGYGAISLISWCTGPAAPVTSSFLTGILAAPIDAASNAAAVACGVALGTATGPV